MTRAQVSIAFTFLLVFQNAGAKGDDVPAAAEAARTPRTSQQAVTKGLEFLIADAAKWRKERGCATCHHGTMSVWALSEAHNRGYAVSAETLADTIAWTKDRFVPRFGQPRDSRPGWNLVSVPAIYFGVMSQGLPILSRDEIHVIAQHLSRHQEEDGGWLMPAPANGAPPTWESRETIALLALLAWESFVPGDSAEAASARAARDKAEAWLATNPPTDTTQATTLRMLLEVRSGRPASQIQTKIDQLISRQNSDGGWSQLKELPSDAYATGQVLWGLSMAGVKGDRSEIARAVAFLSTSQRDDGSWPITPRSHPGVDSTRMRNPVPITYFGSAWAILGLVRSVQPTLDLAVRKQRAFDSIRTFSGSFEVDEKVADKPVVKVNIVYEVSDEELENLAKLLTAFPQLETLQFKSSRITDAGVPHLKALPQLRSLSLENGAITDGGLAELKALTYLEQLNIKGTKVSDGGVQDFQKASPKTKVDR